jgi:hypothetical protein
MPEFDAASFRDPEGRVFAHAGGIFRTLSPAALRRMQRLEADGILDGLTREGLIVDSRLVRAAEAGLDVGRVGDTVMRHARVPFLTYPYEWSFGMLREAALLTLDVAARCLEHGYMLKDATAYNVAWIGGRMRFLDVLSIDHERPGRPWQAYGQFCREFLFPLMLTAYKGIEFQAWLRGSLAGLGPREFARLLGARDLFRRGVLRHVMLQAMLDRDFADRHVRLDEAVGRAPLPKGAVGRTIAGLRRVVASLAYRPRGATWSDYAGSAPYDPSQARRKQEFVRQGLARLRPASVADLGANVGEYSRIAAESADLVVAADLDPSCVDRLYASVAADRSLSKVVPMVQDFTNPSPGVGWNLGERKGFFDRLRADFFLALALVHHLCVGANVPVAWFAAFLRRVAPAGVVEWVDKSDPMVARMLANRADVFPDYAREAFEAELGRHFRVAASETLSDGRRRLYLVVGQGDAG